MKESQNRECKEHDIPRPLFDYGMSGLMLTFQANPQHLSAELGEQEAKQPSGRKAGKTSVKTPMKILQLLEANPTMTHAEVAEEIEKTTRAVELASSKLVKEGRLRYVGPKKGGHWEVLK